MLAFVLKRSGYLSYDFNIHGDDELTISSHSWLAWNTSRDEDNLSTCQAFS